MSNPAPFPSIDESVSVVTPTTQQSTPSQPQGEQTDPSFNIPEVISSKPKSKFGGKKLAATIVGILLLIGAVAAGVVLVRQNQEIRERAAITGTYKVEVLKQNSDGSQVTLVGAKPRTIVRYQEADGSPSSPRVCYQGNNDGQCPQSNDCFGNTGVFQKPLNANGTPCNSIKPGWYAVHWDKTITVGGVTYNIVPTGNIDCETNICSQTEGLVYEGDHQYYHYAVYEPAGGITKCRDIKAYDTDWVLLTNSDLPKLTAGDVLRFVVAGEASSGTFDKARFTINGTVLPETTAVRPGTTSEFYTEYTVPATTTSFTINAQIHHLETNTWY